MQSNLLIFLALLCGFSAKGQEVFSVKGKLTEQTTQNPVPFANIAVYTEKGLNGGVSSDLDGNFTILKLAPGTYTFEIQVIGYQTKKLSNVNVQRNMDLGAINLLESTTVLNEIVVKGEAIRKPVEITAEGMTINPNQNISNTGGSALDVLRNTPSINVDAEGGISLRGSNSTNILINGRNSSISANLDQIPASAIKSIKIVNNPGAKYDADAKGGIINIELKKGDDLGTHGNAEFTMGTAGRYNGAIQLSHQTVKYNIYGGYDIQRPIRPSVSSIFRQSFGENPQTLRQNATFDRSSLNQNIKLGGDYFLGKNQFTYEGVFGNGKDDDTENRISNIVDNDGEENILRNNRETENGFSYDNALIYERSFENEEQSLKIVASNSGRDNTEKQMVETDRMNGNVLEEGIDQRSATREVRNISVLQADYVHPFNNNNKLETGYKTVFRMFDNDFNFENLDNTSGNWIEDNTVSNRFKYQEVVYAAYASYSQKFERFSFAVGSRMEMTNIQTRLFNNNQRNKQQYANFFPSANFQYKLNKKQELRFTYSKRIDRPGGWRLNPFPDIADSLNIRTGNPELRPEYIQSFELGQHLTLGRIDLTTTVFYRYTTGIIDYIVRLEDGIAYGRPENLNDGYDLGFEFIAVSPLTSWLSLNVGYSLFQRNVDGSNVSAEFVNSNLAWNTKAVADFLLPASFKFQITGNYESPEIEAQGTDVARYNVDLSMSKSIKDGKAKISISARDVFNTLRYGGTSFADSFRQERFVKPQSRIFLVSLGFKI
ncbi:TonB-dependent receptor [Chryseotalea sanaruensis]|uniref:TonB-dependent receptor n=1 Tax=Chryseotalea sanaruensis TaxID=2482724 RepID=A0A401U9S4_9BACT|nr:outer membrane beta-barrel family protein [Chryseotalea sanaruensis]GCC51656.1 TonB-dependent receptor [Chryseotalea sanaruensis]